MQFCKHLVCFPRIVLYLSIFHCFVPFSNSAPSFWSRSWRRFSSEQFRTRICVIDSSASSEFSDYDIPKCFQTKSFFPGGTAISPLPLDSAQWNLRWKHFDGKMVWPPLRAHVMIELVKCNRLEGAQWAPLAHGLTVIHLTSQVIWCQSSCWVGLEGITPQPATQHACHFSSKSNVEQHHMCRTLQNPLYTSWSQVLAKATHSHQLLQWTAVVEGHECQSIV